MSQPLLSSQEPTAAPHGLVVIGTSAGGVAALSTLVARLPAEFPFPIVVVLHVGVQPSILPEILSARGSLPAVHASNEERMMAGRIYVARPDCHLIVEDGHLQLSKGPKEHFTRPAIDPLFRSAALAYGPAAIGVILTGTMEDGTAGLQAIKQCGGIAIVQDPADAQAPGMPRSALKYVEVDHCGPIESIADALIGYAASPPATRTPASASRSDLVHEQELFLAEGDPMEHLPAIASPSGFVCPDCQGGLWRLHGNAPIRFRCHTGHAYTLKTLQAAFAETSDSALWSALRALQEQVLLLEMTIGQLRREKDAAEVSRVESLLDALRKEVHNLRSLIERHSTAS